MTDVEREESETGKFSKWVHVKNNPADYPSTGTEDGLQNIDNKLNNKLNTSDLNIDGSKNVGVNVQNNPADYPSTGTEDGLQNIDNKLNNKLNTSDLNIDGSKNVGVNVQNEPVIKVKGSTDGGSTWVPLKVDADGKVILVTT